MSKMFPVQDMILKSAANKLARNKIIRPLMPLTVTFSITYMCQSRCKTCNIWDLYRKNPKLKEKELNLKEIEDIFKSIGHVYFFNISGGEPFLRKDIHRIVELACKYLKPGVIHIPTNAISPKLVEEGTIKILEVMKKNKWNVPLTLKPSFDGIGKQHDDIRGVKGNFKSLSETIQRLKGLQKKYPNLDVGVGTVISVYNVKDIKKIAEYSKKWHVDSYINEIAEERSELFTDGKITPSAEDYKKAILDFSKVVGADMRKMKPLSRVTQAFRQVYYDLVVRTLKEKRQVIPCFGGLTNVQLNPYGDVWPCCVLGYNKSMGNLRDVNYDFKKIWYSKEAAKVRDHIRKGRCHCPLANQYYSNILCNYYSMLKVVKNMFFL